MAVRLHAPTRRELLLGSGVLFAWAHVPRIARAEGRDPRMLVIVLRGALDGLAAVAPVGDPDWVGLRGDRALLLDGKTPALPLDAFFALNPAMPNLHRLYKARAGHHRARRRDALSRALAFRRPGRAGERTARSRAPARRAGSTARSARIEAGRPRRSAAARRAFAVGPVTPLVVRGSAPVLSWVPQRLLPASDDTSCACSTSIAIPTRRSRVRWRRARPDASGARRRHGHAGQQQGRSPAGLPRARLFRRSGRHRGAVSGAAGRPARRRDRLCRLGHAHQRGRRRRPARQPARRARRRHRRHRDQHGQRLARDGGGDRHRVRPHGAHQRQRGHRPRHRHDRAADRRRAARAAA